MAEPGREKKLLTQLSRRQRQIMDAVFRLGSATAKEIREGMPDPPTLDAVRRMIRVLEDRGLLRHRKDGPRHVYVPTARPAKARRSALDHVVRVHFQGSVSAAMASLIESHADELSPEDLTELTRLIREARREGR